MRFARPCSIAAAAALALLSGCSTLRSNFQTAFASSASTPAAPPPPPAATAVPASAAPAVPTPAVPAAAPTAAPSATAPGAVAAPPKPVEAPVSPAVQRAFDDARRALKAGHAAEAERGFLVLTGSNPELGGPHANLGIIYRQAGKLAEAAAEFEKATAASPQQPLYFNELGVTYRLRGAFDKARDAYEKAIALDPNYAAAHLNLGILYDLYLWDSAHALEHYDRYMSLSPGGDDKVKKWIADLKNRSQQHSMLTQQEKK